MKLRNKKTGEIIDLDIANIKAQFGAISVIPEPAVLSSPEYVYTSLAELTEEWEDYEEPKVYWYMSNRGDIRCIDDEDTEWDNNRRQIGNYFETPEEAEKAVEKLKAWQRLKYKGFKVDLWDYDGGNYQERIKTGRILFRVKDYEENDKDLDLLFGGEE